MKLTMTCSPSGIAKALLDGTVKPRGIELQATTNEDALGRQQTIREGQFDVSEFFTGTYIADLPYRKLPFAAIPVYPLRIFRHSCMHVNRKSDIRKPSDLNGRRVAIRFWNITAGLWIKGMLEEDFGVDLASITWVTTLPAAIPNWKPPSWLKLEMSPNGATEYDLLAANAVPAGITAEVWPPDRHPDIGYLLPDYQEREREFFERTKCVPIMHTLVVKKEILDAHPWVARSLFDAWEESKKRCYEQQSWPQPLHAPPPARRGSPSRYEFGFSKSRHELDVLLTYAYRQGVTPRKYEPEDLFMPSMLET
jgi:4,5-dihydroxyphthalate decarboxylase